MCYRNGDPPRRRRTPTVRRLGLTVAVDSSGGFVSSGTEPGLAMTLPIPKTSSAQVCVLVLADNEAEVIAPLSVEVGPKRHVRRRSVTNSASSWCRPMVSR
jgi:hypothetical protein